MKDECYIGPRNPLEPYEDLYVYLVGGVVGGRDEAALGSEFLGTWVEGETSFLFFSAPAQERVDSLIKGRPGLSFVEEHLFSYEEWQGTNLDPVRIGEFLVVPPWKSEATGETEVRIVLDPGVVFGTGIHPTTADCLQALSHLRKRFAFESVLDLGTGTGILAVAAAALGAKEVLAVDLNPLCVKTAKRNVGHNRREGLVEVIEGRAEDWADKPADLVVANIQYDVLKSLLENEAFRKRKWFIFSGLMRSQGRDIKARLANWGLDIVMEWDGEGTWTTMLVAGRERGLFL